MKKKLPGNKKSNWDYFLENLWNVVGLPLIWTAVPIVIAILILLLIKACSQV